MHRDEGGQAIALVAVMFLTMLMFVGLAIDAGQLFVARRTMQEAADAAAYAGAVVLYQNSSAATPEGGASIEPKAVQAAKEDAERNGYKNGINGASVEVNLPPTSGPHANDRLYVEVKISENVRTVLVPAQSTLTLVGVRAVAGSEPLNNQYGIMALDRTNYQGALNVGSGGVIHVTGGGVLSNSTHPSGAALADQNADIIYTCAQTCYTDVAGGAGPDPSDWPNLRTGQPQEPDPFAGYPKPAIPSCATAPNTSCIYNSISGDPAVLQPGVYTVALSHNKDTVLMPGVYILKGKGMSFTGNNHIYSAGLEPSNPRCTTACGVFIFNTTTNYPNAGGTCERVDLGGTGNLWFAPPTSGTYKGMTFYQDAACGSGSSMSFDVHGGGDFQATGTIYIPNNLFSLDGQNATLSGSQIVALHVNVQNGDLAVNFQAGTTAQPILPRLAE